jgi:hypothetical protein
MTGKWEKKEKSTLWLYPWPLNEGGRAEGSLCKNEYFIYVLPLAYQKYSPGCPTLQNGIPYSEVHIYPNNNF